MKTIYLLAALLVGYSSYAQVHVFDQGHFNIVNENGLMREVSEMRYQSDLNKINTSLNHIQINLTSVILVQSIIRQSLTEANGLLKSGLMAQQVVSLSAQIISESQRLLATARNAPEFILFAERAAWQLKERGFRLATEVGEFILKEKEDVLLDHEKRDALLRKTILELKVIRALVFSMERAIYWAKMKGLIRSLNPYQHFINRDKVLIDRILSGYHILKEKR